VARQLRRLHPNAQSRLSEKRREHMQWEEHMTDLDITIGSVRVRRVEEVLSPQPPGAVLAGATPDALLAHRDWLLPDYVDEEGNLLMSIQSILLNADGKKIVVDTCMGANVPAPMAEYAVTNSTYLEDLAKAGFDRESVDIVICTHLHVDHVGWNTIGEGADFVPTFPNARYLFTDEAVESFRTLPEAAAVVFGVPAAVQPVFDASLADVVPTTHQVTKSVQLVPTPGHTPGHVSLRIDSGGGSAFVTGDMTHHPVQWAEPHWANVTDFDQGASTETRRKLAAELADTDIVVIGTHYAWPVAGRLISTEGGHRLVPLRDGN
jgi:glyoxylase-like metal-dependent hydrolase (beta-lactamase superfamily II)